MADEDEYAGLPDEYGVSEVDGLASPAFADWSTERKVELALEVERAARARGGVTQVENAVYSDERGLGGARELARVRGLLRGHPGVGLRLGVRGRGRGPDDGPRAWASAATPARSTPRRSAPRPPSGRWRSSGARQPESRRCPVVLDAFVAASFVGFIGSMLSADAVQRGRSLFAGREGDEVADPALALADDGTDADGPVERARSTARASPTRRTPLIEGGRLLGFLYDARTARRAGRATTGNASRGSYRSPPSVGTHQPDARAGRRTTSTGLVARGRRRALRDRRRGPPLGGQPRVRHVLGGRLGRLIEGGELGAPVREITIASDLVSMLQAVQAVGSEARWVPFGGSVKAPPVLIGRDVGLRLLSAPGKVRNKRAYFPACEAKNALLSSGCVVTLRPVSCPRQGGDMTKTEFVDQVGPRAISKGRGRQGRRCGP